MNHPLPLTGERTLPGVRGEEYWFARHEAAYRWIVEQHVDELDDAVVVEAGSGEGYGAALLGRAGARLVVAVEYDEAASAHAATAYPDVRGLRANLAAVPLAAGCADVVVSLQVVEHLWDLRGFLRDCTRVLRAGGLLVVSTPNRPVFSPGLRRGERPTNPFHVEELDADQLRELLVEAGLDDVAVAGLRHGPRIVEWERLHRVGLVASQIQAVLSASSSAADVTEAFVATVTVDDFLVGAADGAQDLLATAVRR